MALVMIPVARNSDSIESHRQNIEDKGLNKVNKNLKTDQGGDDNQGDQEHDDQQHHLAREDISKQPEGISNDPDKLTQEFEKPHQETDKSHHKIAKTLSRGHPAEDEKLT